MKKRTGIYRKCKLCGNDFYVYNYLVNIINRGRFCSKKCANIFNSKELSISRIGSGNPMFGKKSWNNGLLGVQIGKRGKDSHFWKGGKVNLNYSIRRTNEYKLWRKSVFERDNYTCQDCGKIGGYLEPHHIVPLNKLIKKYHITNIINAKKCKDLWDIKRGVTLCNNCHRKTDSYLNNKQ